MKTRLLPFSLGLLIVALSGCGQGGNGSAEAPAAPAAAVAGPREIDISAGDDMKYSVTALTAKPGESLKVVLSNVGSVPKEAMAHNWVLLKTGADPAAFATAAISQKANNYIPSAMQDEILAKIDLVGPKSSGEADFTAPAIPGDYPFLCTFPAHYQVGMHGILTVK